MKSPAPAERSVQVFVFIGIITKEVKTIDRGISYMIYSNIEYKVSFYKDSKGKSSVLKKTIKTPPKEIERAENNYYDIINNSKSYE